MDHVSVQGVDVPALGLGTYKLQGAACTAAVRAALGMGYRHVDTAAFYSNETAVGEGLVEAPVDRDDVFLTTKVWRTNLEARQVHASVRDSLDALGVDAVDLLLIHWPSRSGVPIEETVGAMNELQAEGAVHYIGVSNFSIAELEEAMEASATPILTNQVEYHPYFDRSDLLGYCRANDVMLTAYSPLAKGEVADDPTLAEIGAAHGKTAAQVAIRWLLQQDPVVAIPKSSGRDHLAENADVFDFELTSQEMERIHGLARP